MLERAFNLTWFWTWNFHSWQTCGLESLAFNQPPDADILPAVKNWYVQFTITVEVRNEMAKGDMYSTCVLATPGTVTSRNPCAPCKLRQIQILWPYIAIRLKFASSSIIRVWTSKKLPRSIRYSPDLNTYICPVFVSPWYSGDLKSDHLKS